MLVYLGEIAEGMALLDEAMVSIEAGELSPMATGDAYCTVIDACAELFDLGRCRSWTESFQRWCDTQQELVLYRGHCFLHRAEVLGLLGHVARGARRGPPRLRPPRRPGQPRCLGAACAIEGDLLRLARRPRRGRGRLPARQPRSATTPSPASPCCAWPRSRLDAADAMIRRALGEAHGPVLACSPARSLRRDRARHRRHRCRPHGRRRAPRRRGRAADAAARRTRRPGRAAPCSWPRATPGQRSSSCAAPSTSSTRSACATTPPEPACSSPRPASSLGDHDAAAIEAGAGRSALDAAPHRT